jgi:predicted aspartyl protease
VESLLDTGFDGYVTLPPHMIPISEAADGDTPGQLADGTFVQLNYYYATMTIEDLGTLDCNVIAMGDEPLVGRAVSDRFMVILDHGRQLIVEP